MSNCEVMTEEQANEFFSDIFGGLHHLPGKVKPYGLGWTITSRKDLATWDGNLLTKLVFLAHEKCVRVDISPCNMNLLRISIWQRKGRDGSMSERHPDLETAVTDFKNWYFKPKEV